uniref:Uncharacterized protein n=1 Tax=Babesia bovis TaxID=5865 RepID=S6AZA4_BABBO|nr:hypothetical protein [Babesia bovis]
MSHISGCLPCPTSSKTSSRSIGAPGLILFSAERMIFTVTAVSKPENGTSESRPPA